MELSLWASFAVSSRRLIRTRHFVISLFRKSTVSSFWIIRSRLERSWFNSACPAISKLFRARQCIRETSASTWAIPILAAPKACSSIWTNLGASSSTSSPETSFFDSFTKRLETGRSISILNRLNRVCRLATWRIGLSGVREATHSGNGTKTPNITKMIAPMLLKRIARREARFASFLPPIEESTALAHAPTFIP